MKINKTQAAEMAGVSRSTFYLHIKNKPISVDAQGQIDVSELIRVYGSDQIKSLDELAKPKQAGKSSPSDSQEPILQKELDLAKTEIETLRQERRRERQQFEEQVEDLRGNLKEVIESNKRLTLTLTDQRSEAQKERDEREAGISQVISRLNAMEEERKTQRRGLWSRIFGN